MEDSKIWGRVCPACKVVHGIGREKCVHCDGTLLNIENNKENKTILPSLFATKRAW